MRYIGLALALIMLHYATALDLQLNESITTLQSGTGSSKLSLIFMPSGFTPAESAAFQAQVQANLNQLWQNNFFKDYRQRFDIYRIDGQYDEDGELKTDQEIVDAIHTYGCSFGDSGACKNIHVVIEDHHDYYDETTYDFVRLRLEASGDYTLPHEISVHVLGNLRPYGGPIMKDEYIVDKNCALNNYTYTFINAHDRNSNEKWSDLVPGQPSLGSAYCSHFFRPTASAIARGSNNRDCDNVGYRAAEMGLSKRSHDGGIYDESVKPTVSVSGITIGKAYCCPMKIKVNAIDGSGIDRAEFYVSVDNREFRSAGVDRTAPYEQILNLSSLNGSEFYLRIYVYDKAWNYVGHPSLQYGPLYASSTQCGGSQADNNGDCCTDTGELIAYMNNWRQGNGIQLSGLMEAVKQWKQGC